MKWPQNTWLNHDMSQMAWPVSPYCSWASPFSCFLYFKPTFSLVFPMPYSTKLFLMLSWLLGHHPYCHKKMIFYFLTSGGSYSKPHWCLAFIETLLCFSRVCLDAFFGIIALEFWLDFTSCDPPYKLFQTWCFSPTKLKFFACFLLRHIFHFAKKTCLYFECFDWMFQLWSNLKTCKEKGWYKYLEGSECWFFLFFISLIKY